MVHFQASIGTVRAQRYLDQMARHAAAVAGRQHAGSGGFGHPAAQVRVEHTGSSCTLTFPGLGACLLTADADHLTARVDGVDVASAQRVVDLVTADLRRFSGRDPLTIDWHQG